MIRRLIFWGRPKPTGYYFRCEICYTSKIQKTFPNTIEQIGGSTRLEVPICRDCLNIWKDKQAIYAQSYSKE